MIRIFRTFIPVSTLTLFLADMLLVGASFVAGCYLVWQVDPTDYLLYDGGVLAILVVTIAFLVGCYFSGFYSDVYVKSRIILLYQLCLVAGLTFLFEGLVSSVFQQLRVPIRAMVAGSCLALPVTFGWHVFFGRYASRMLGKAKMLLVGTDPAIAAVGKYVEAHPECGFELAGCVRDEGFAGDWLPAIDSCGDVGSLPEIVERVRPGRIVVGTRAAATAEFARILEDLRYAGHNVQDAAETYEKISGMVWARGVQPLDLVYKSRFGAPRSYLMLQRFLNVMLALAALVLVLPALTLTWLVLKLRGAGGVWQAQTRVGMNNKRFTCYRWNLQQASAGAAKKTVLAGMLGTIRRLHLDGLPQLLNVLKGEMSLVGPRPDPPEVVEALTEIVPYYPQRHCARPGMTGWAQIKEGGTPDTLANLEYDLYYIKYMCTSLDALILFETLREMFLAAVES
jgi:lipopolysaccharide/colanic/teichoic acid biosynthesis glycosyltransferase